MVERLIKLTLQLLFILVALLIIGFFPVAAVVVLALGLTIINVVFKE